MFLSYEAMPLFTVVYTVAHLPVIVFFYSIDIKKIMNTVKMWFKTSFRLVYLPGWI